MTILTLSREIYLDFQKNERKGISESIKNFLLLSFYTWKLRPHKESRICDDPNSLWFRDHYLLGHPRNRALHTLDKFTPVSSSKNIIHHKQLRTADPSGKHICHMSFPNTSGQVPFRSQETIIQNHIPKSSLLTRTVSTNLRTC